MNSTFSAFCCNGITSQIHVFKYSLELAVSHPDSSIHPLLGKHFSNMISRVPLWNIACCSLFLHGSDWHLL